MKILGMDVHRRKTDEELVEIVRKNLRRSKWVVGLIFFTACLQFALAIFIFCVVYDFTDDRGSISGTNNGLYLGFGLGMIIAIIFFQGLYHFQLAVRHLLGDRSDHLLLRYHDELQALGRIPQEDPHG